MKASFKYHLLLFLFCFSLIESVAQNSLIGVNQTENDYGELENIYSLQSEFIITNNANKNLYFLRADADKDLKIRVNKKTLPPGDTTHLIIYFQPENTGRFDKEIKLITSASGEPFILKIKGHIKSIKNDDKTACYYFGRPNKHLVSTSSAIVMPSVLDKEDPTELVPDSISYPSPKITATRNSDSIPSVSKETLNRILYKPNNLVFLIDISNSMRDSSKLPLMKRSLYELIKNTRDIDKITLITYADSVLLRCEAVDGSNKEELKKTISALNAHGYTKGAKAILFAMDVAVKNYIEDGNNQVFLATDGKFQFKESHYEQWLKKSQGKEIILSAIAFGNDKEALINLKGIAKFGKGSFIQIRNFDTDKNALIDEIKLRSQRH